MMNDNSVPRTLTSHQVSELNSSLSIIVTSEPYLYEVYGDDGDGFQCAISFQNRPFDEVGVNGLTNEALLAIVEDRLKIFQEGDYKCRENAIALTHIQDALHWLHHRTRARLARGVEGKMIP